MANQNESHDWFGECAEKYVAYLLSKADKELNMAVGSKWGVDIIARKGRKVTWTFEVRSTYKDKSIRKPSIEKMKKKQVDFYAEVKKKSGIQVRIFPVVNGMPNRTKVWQEEDGMPLIKFLEENSANGNT